MKNGDLYITVWSSVNRLKKKYLYFHTFELNYYGCFFLKKWKRLYIMVPDD